MSLLFKKSVFCSIFILFFLSTICFAENEIVLTPDVLWYSVNQAQWIGGGSNKVDIIAECPNTTTYAVAQIKMGLNILSKPAMTYSDGFYRTIYRPPSVSPFGGTYEVKVKCNEYWINETKTFSIHNIKLNIDGVSSFQTYEKTVMMDKTVDIDIYTTLFDNENHIDIDYLSSDDELSFSAKIYTDDNNVLYDGVVNVDKREPNTRTNYGDWILHLGKMPQSSIVDKDYNVKLTINYKDKITSIIESAFFHFNGFEEEEEEEEEPDDNDEVAADYFYAELSDLCDPLYLATDTSNTNVYITINQSVSNFELKKEHIVAYLYDDNEKIATLMIEEIIKDSSRDYKIILDEIPFIDIEKDNYKIILYLNYPNNNEISLNIPVEIASEFGGTVKKKDGVVVSTTLEIRKTGFYKKLKTNTKGEFSTIIPFGTYDIKFVFEDNTDSPVVMKIEGAIFEKTETSVKFAKNSITYDNINSGETDIDLNGMRVANMIVFQFALPFDNVEIQTYYDASKIYNEENIAVFRCSNWNNGAQNCISGFKEISDITKNINSDFVIIQSTGLGSFIISSIDSLKIELNKLNKNYLSLEDMVFEGMVLDMESKVLDKATVHYYIKNTQIAGKIETNEDGSFETIFEAPEKSGIYRMYYYADKIPFFPSKNESTTFEVLQKPDMEVVLPSSDSLKITPDQKTNLDFIIRNNGDLTLNDIRIDIECDGLSEKDDYNYYPKTLDRLSTGTEEKITFFIELKNELCELYGCKTVYSCGLTIESEEKTISESMMLPLNVDSKEDTLEENTIQITEAQLESNEAIQNTDEKDQEYSSFIPKISITGFASKITNPFEDNTNSMNLKIAAVFILIILSIIVFRNKNTNSPQTSFKYNKKFKPSGGIPRKNIINSFNKIKKEINGGS